MIASAAMVAPTLIYLISMLPFGLPEPGPVAGGYLGTLFLCAAFSAIGVFASSITKNQIIAFFTAFIICIVLTMISEFLIFLPGPIVEFLSFISANQHFTSISRGIIDTRDLVYFVSLRRIEVSYGKMYTTVFRKSECCLYRAFAISVYANNFSSVVFLYS